MYWGVKLEENSKWITNSLAGLLIILANVRKREGHLEISEDRSGETEGYCITFFHNFFALSPLFCSDCFSFGISRGTNFPAF
ncbi:unnamed protein product [Onchocerca flexuosa]|uniref:Ovule protein n=1 Tax=Onchocerca flexuosa TaxID=387005 RepID=A0A183H7G9_9BILA|nr:unnamed protein product [Onchocerca flexuosa]